MTSTLVQGAAGIFTGLPGAAMRATGAIRIVDGRIAAVGSLEREPGEQVIDASGCVVYPGLVSTHHHLFQCVLKGVRAAIDSPLLVWLRAVPYAYWHKIDEDALRTAARIGLVELLLSGTTTAADHHYLFAESYRFDPADVIFEVAEQLGIRLVFCRGGATKARGFDTPDIIPTPVEPIDTMIKSVEACAQRHHDPSPDSMRRVAFAPTTPPWSLAPDQPRVIAAAARRMGCAFMATCPRPWPTSSSAWRPMASGQSRGWPITTTSGATSGSPISCMWTMTRFAFLPKPEPAWRIARNRIAVLARASHRRKGSRPWAVPCRWRSTAPHQTNPPT
jgi:cytosine/adenosine deaminase-related metal-dependent hydrolase